MLVLARQAGEEILIGDDVRIVVLESRKGQVKLGIEAPRDVHIVRRELVVGKEQVPSSAAAGVPPCGLAPNKLPPHNLAASLEVA